MMKSIKLKSALAAPLLAVALAAMVALGGSHSVTRAQETKDLDRAAIEKIIQEYLLANPELLIDMQQALEAKQEEARQLSQAKTLEEKHDQIFNAEDEVTIGNPDAAITVVEFFDYNCGFCKRAMADMDRMVEENPDVKFVMKEFPVLGEGSLQASQVSLSVMFEYPELFADFHRKLLSAPGQKDGPRALEVAGELGADVEKLKASMSDGRAMNKIREAYELADGLGITGTPSYIIGNEVIFGAVGYSRILPKVANVRQCGKTEC